MLPFLDGDDFNLSLAYGVRVFHEEVRYHAGLMVGF